MVLKDADIVVVAINHDDYTRLGWRKFSSYLKPNAYVSDLWNIFGKNKTLYAARSYPLVGTRTRRRKKTRRR